MGQAVLNQETFWVNAGGVRLRCRKQGDGPPLLLIHGLVGSLDNWTVAMDSLSEHSTVFAVDLPNMGGSERRSGIRAHLRATAHYLLSLMDALGLPSADVVGHSHGGAVAMMLAALAPQRVRRLVLFAPANPFCDRSRGIRRFYTSAWGRRFAHLIPFLPSWPKSLAHRRMYGRPELAPAAALPGYTDGLTVPGTIAHILRVLESWDSSMRDLAEVLARGLEVPALLIWGDRDRAVLPSSAGSLAQCFAHASLHMLAEVGHIPFEEQPELSSSLVTRWLQSPAVATTGSTALKSLSARRSRPRQTAPAPTAAALAASPTA